MCVREKEKEKGKQGGESEGERKESEKRELNLRDSAAGMRPLGTTGRSVTRHSRRSRGSVRRERKREKESTMRMQPTCSRDASPPVRTNDVRARARARGWLTRGERYIEDLSLLSRCVRFFFFPPCRPSDPVPPRFPPGPGGTRMNSLARNSELP